MYKKNTIKKKHKRNFYGDPSIYSFVFIFLNTRGTFPKVKLNFFNLKS